MASSALNSVIGNPLSADSCFDFLSRELAAASDGRSIPSGATHERASRSANTARGVQKTTAARGEGLPYGYSTSEDTGSRGICVSLTLPAAESCSGPAAMFPKDSRRSRLINGRAAQRGWMKPEVSRDPAPGLIAQRDVH